MVDRRVRHASHQVPHPQLLFIPPLAAGCFWGVEAELRNVPGVVATQVGYIGGFVNDPTYELVCTHTTGHAEAVEVEFDPEQVSYERVLEVFWAAHDPTQVDRQGPDVGDQYRTAIFTHSPEQQAAAEASRGRAQASLRKPIATQIRPAGTFYPAEEYHQRYLERRGLASCLLPDPERRPSVTRP